MNSDIGTTLTAITCMTTVIMFALIGFAGSLVWFGKRIKLPKRIGDLFDRLPQRMRDNIKTRMIQQKLENEKRRKIGKLRSYSMASSDLNFYVSRPLQFAVSGIAFSVFVIMTWYFIMTNDLVTITATGLAQYALSNGLTWHEVYAGFGTALIVLVYLAVTIFYILIYVAETHIHELLLEVTAELDDKIDEHLAEIQYEMQEEVINRLRQS